MEVTFWEGFYKALNCEFKDITEIKGASGITHQVNSLGINHNEKKIIISQNEQDARILAMAQNDISSRIKDYNVLMVRPVPFNLTSTFSILSLGLGTNIMSLKSLSESEDDSTEKLLEENKDTIESAFSRLNPQIEIIQKTSLNLVPIFKELVFQLSHLKFIKNIEDSNEFDIDFTEMLNFNPLIYDNALGVCPLPFYDFTKEEAESFLNTKNKVNNEEILKRHNVHQFFNPPPDSLALGLVESGITLEEKVIETVTKVPEIGHPFGHNELIDVDKLENTINALKDKNLVVDGEFGIIVSNDGIEKRASIKFSPRESIFKRISNLISFKVNISSKDLKDILKQ